MSEPTFDAVERALRKRRFATLASMTEDGRPHATGVVYAISPPGEPICLYVTTNAKNKKVANIRANPDVALVVPPPGRSSRCSRRRASSSRVPPRL